MNVRSNIVRILLPLVGLALLGAMVVFRHGPALRYDANDPAYNRAYWTQEVTSSGAAAAYEEFKERTSVLPENRQHFAAHVIGSAIGEAVGPDGIKVCDASFGFGCYHGLFSDVIARGGATLIEQLDAACVEAYGQLGTGCQHGIGHGILEYVGYDHVNDALALCKKTTQVVPLLGCTSGVFMEYFSPLTGPADALVPSMRTLDPAHPYAPCTDVPKENQASCYYELGGYLRTSGGSVAMAGKTCSGLSGSARENCVMGAGTLAMHVNGNDVTRAHAECAALSATDQLFCRAGVRWAVFQIPERRSEAAIGCAYADPVLEKKCETLGDLTHGLDPH
jgi:hypothetical protein